MNSPPVTVAILWRSLATPLPRLRTPPLYSARAQTASVYVLTKVEHLVHGI